ncbi:MAG: VTT domain-containing protein [Candidatus Zixiibacteriota bacterium]
MKSSRMSSDANLININRTPDHESAVNKKNNGKSNGLFSIITTAAIIIIGVVIVAIFKEDINNFGLYLINNYGQRNIDIILFLLTAISSSPICLPVWQFVLIGTTMGYSVIHLAAVMALGSALGSLVTYYMGRLFGNSRFFTKRFPDAGKNRWVHGRSKLYVTIALFLGTASPIPFDILYFACGVKKYPPGLLYIANTLGRLVRYTYLGYGFYLINK